MKYILIFSLLFVFTNKFSAQEWAPVGSRWIYSYYGTTEQDQIYNYYKYEVVEDTLIEGKNVRKVEFMRFRHTAEPELLRTEYLFMEDNKIFFYKWNRFNLLYNFNLQEGESYMVQTIDDENLSGTFNCNDRFDYNTNGSTYTFFGLYSSDNLFFGAEILGQVGSMKNFFPTNQGVIEFEYERLRCFITADTLYYYEEDWFNFCEHFRTLKIDEVSKEGLKFSPNPVSNISNLIIPYEMGEIREVSIKAINGQYKSIFTRNNQSIQINRSNFESGIYFIEVQTDKQKLFGKFVVE